jgi:hypothetical protein
MQDIIEPPAHMYHLPVLRKTDVERLSARTMLNDEVVNAFGQHWHQIGPVVVLSTLFPGTYLTKAKFATKRERLWKHAPLSVSLFRYLFQKCYTNPPYLSVSSMLGPSPTGY